MLILAISGSQITVRKAGKADDAALLAIMHALFPNSRTKVREGDIVLVAECKGALSGFCHLRLREKTAYISGLGVLPECRNKGAGSALLSRALSLIDKSGIDTVLLKVRALNHASSLYVKFGFVEKRMGETLLLVRKRPS